MSYHPSFHYHLTAAKAIFLNPEDMEFVTITKLSTIMKLKCGCNISLHKLMAVMGKQVKDGEEVLCPFHQKKHDFSDNNIMKHSAVAYLEHCLEGRKDDFITFFPPLLH